MKVPVSPSSPFPTEQGWSRYMLACSEAALLCRKIKVAHYKKKEVYSLTKPYVSVIQHWQTHSFSHFCFVGFPSSLFSFFFMTSDQSGYSRIVSPLVSLQQCLALIFISILVLQVYPVGPQREPEEHGQLCTLPQSAARVWAVPLGGRHPVPQPFAARRDRVWRSVSPARSDWLWLSIKTS